MTHEQPISRWSRPIRSSRSSGRSSPTRRPSPPRSGSSPGSPRSPTRCDQRWPGSAGCADGWAPARPRGGSSVRHRARRGRRGGRHPRRRLAPARPARATLGRRRPLDRPRRRLAVDGRRGSVAIGRSRRHRVVVRSGGPIPADFQPASATFASADDGWLLGTATCAAAPCAAIVRTTDGGRTWASIPAPKAAFAAGGSGTSGVSGLRFADALDGWAFGPDLWATHDGGTTWRRVTLPGLSADGQVMTLETAAGAVHAVYFDGSAAGLLTIATSPAGTDAWAVSPTTVELGAGPVPHPQLVLHGTAGWLVEVDRVVVAGARLVAGAWEPWQPPCATVAGPATLAAASASDLVVACDEGLWSTPTGVHVYSRRTAARRSPRPPRRCRSSASRASRPRLRASPSWPAACPGSVRRSSARSTAGRAGRPSTSSRAPARWTSRSPPPRRGSRSARRATAHPSCS